MAQRLLEELRQRIDQVVRLRCTDGEIISARIEFISEEKTTADPLRLRSGQAFDFLRYAPVAQDDRSLVMQSFCAESTCTG